jgi:hypothetical protein
MATVIQVYQQSSSGSVQLLSLGQGVGQAGPVQLNAIRQGFQRYWDPLNLSVSGQPNQLATNFKDVNLYAIQGQAQATPASGATAQIPSGYAATRYCINLQGSLTGPAGQSAITIVKAAGTRYILVKSSCVLIGGGGAGGDGKEGAGVAGGAGAAAITQDEGAGTTFNFFNSGKVFGGGGGGGGGGGAPTPYNLGGGGGGGGAAFGIFGQSRTPYITGQGGSSATSQVVGSGGLGAQQGIFAGGNGGNGGLPGQAGQAGQIDSEHTNAGGGGGARGEIVPVGSTVTWSQQGQHQV